MDFFTVSTDFFISEAAPNDSKKSGCFNTLKVTYLNIHQRVPPMGSYG